MNDLSYEGRTVFCRDVPAAARFYEDVLGFQRASEGGGDIVLRLPVAGNPGASVTFYLHPGNAPDPVDLGTFRVEDVDAFLAAVRAAGHPVAAQPTDTPWGLREASIRDPEGNGLLITSPIGG
jgi:catechol 2,3-dioxygenase-like lactoylglutathione lyase family enzyme